MIDPVHLTLYVAFRLMSVVSPIVIAIYLLAVIPESFLRLAATFLEFGTRLRKLAVERRLLGVGVTSDVVWEAVQGLGEFQLIVGDQVATLHADDAHDVVVMLGNGSVASIPNFRAYAPDKGEAMLDPTPVEESGDAAEASTDVAQPPQAERLEVTDAHAR